MSTLVPYKSYDRSLETYFKSHKVKKHSSYYNQQQLSLLPRLFPTSVFYPPNVYPPRDRNQFGRSDMSMELVGFNAMQNHYPKREVSFMPPSIHKKPSRRQRTSGFDGADPRYALTTIIPPNLRAFFIPTGSSSLQQSSMGALYMPPFLYNRMPQALNSLPLPPPLPQINLLPLTPAIQQIVMQQYANPVAVFPYSSNCPSASIYPQVVSQQSSAPQLMPINISMPPSAPYLYTSYPNTCRACIPAPPSLHTSVQGHCWIQHCSACHYVPDGGTRPNNGRFTPLLRYPTIKQNVYNPPVQKHRYPDISRSTRSRPWLYDMPPLPPNAVIISDEYISEKNIDNASGISSDSNLQYPRFFKSKSRSGTSSETSVKLYQTKPIRKGRKTLKDDQYQSNTKPSSIAASSISATPVFHRLSLSLSSSSSTTSSSCSICRAERANPVRSQSAGGGPRNVNYQPEDIPTVFNNNQDLKSTNTTSIASPKFSQDNEGYYDVLLSPASTGSLEKDDQNSNRATPSQDKQPAKKILIIRRLETNSSPTDKINLSDQSFQVLDRNLSSASITDESKEEDDQ